MNDTDPDDLIQTDHDRHADDGGHVPDDPVVPAAVALAGDATAAPRQFYLTLESTEGCAQEAFARHFSVPEFRERFNRLFPLWRFYNATGFDSRFEVPISTSGGPGPTRWPRLRTPRATRPAPVAHAGTNVVLPDSSALKE